MATIRHNTYYQYIVHDETDEKITNNTAKSDTMAGGRRMKFLAPFR